MWAVGRHMWANVWANYWTTSMVTSLCRYLIQPTLFDIQSHTLYEHVYAHAVKFLTYCHPILWSVLVIILHRGLYSCHECIYTSVMKLLIFIFNLAVVVVPVWMHLLSHVCSTVILWA